MSQSITKLARTSLLIAAVATTSIAFAGERTGDRDGKKGRRGPPPQAFEACEGLDVGAACEVTTRRGNLLAGECKVPRRLRQRLAAENAATESGATENGADAPSESEPVLTEDTLVCAPEHRNRRQQSELR